MNGTTRLNNFFNLQKNSTFKERSKVFLMMEVN